MIAKLIRGCQAVKVYEEDEESVQSVEEIQQIHEEEINNNNINNNNNNYGKQNNNNNDENEEDEKDVSDDYDSIPALQERYVEDSSDDDDDEKIDQYIEDSTARTLANYISSHSKSNQEQRNKMGKTIRTLSEINSRLDPWFK
jgi:hypothetical protein